MRRFFLGAALILPLLFGCAGAVQGAANLAGVEMAMGANAVHPVDFAVKPPATGKKVMSVAMEAEADQLQLPEGADIPLPEGSVFKMEMIVYEGVSAYAEELAKGTALLEADGFKLKVQDSKEVAVFEKSGEMFVVVAEDDSYVLIRLRPVVPEAAPPK